LRRLALRRVAIVPGLAAAPGLYGIAGLVALTRVYPGVHFPRDVIASAIPGLTRGGLGVWVAPYL
jgi:membrane-associated phospholipid phosphatase